MYNVYCMDILKIGTITPEEFSDGLPLHCLLSTDAFICALSNLELETTYSPKCCITFAWLQTVVSVKVQS